MKIFPGLSGRDLTFFSDGTSLRWDAPISMAVMERVNNGLEFLQAGVSKRS